MKKFTLSLAFAALMTAVALIFSGCSDDPEVGPEAPVISAKDMQVPATAGKQKLAYSIAHPVEGQSISAESDQTWIHDFEYTDANIAFQVDANEGEARTAALTLKYEGAADLKSRSSRWLSMLRSKFLLKRCHSVIQAVKSLLR